MNRFIGEEYLVGEKKVYGIVFENLG